MSHKVEMAFGNSNISIETGRIAKLAGGSVMVQQGGTVVLVAACAASEPREGVDFLPLTIDYREKTYAAGKIPGGFFKREGRPTEKEILSARVIDRPLRPLFPKGMHNELQVMVTVLSCDGEYDPDVLALVGSSCAVTISDIPFDGPIAACRVGQIDGEFILNPTFAQTEESAFNVVVACSRETILMIEGSFNEVPEDTIHEALMFAFKNLQGLIDLQEDLRNKCGKEKRDYALRVISDELKNEVNTRSVARIKEILQMPQKEDRTEGMKQLSSELCEALVNEDTGVTKLDVKTALHDVERDEVRTIILNEKRRMDGRAFTEIRPLSTEISFLPRTHGSAVFTRGETQSLCVTTLGTSSDEQLVESLEGESKKTFMLHYNFPPYSVGEVRPNRGPGRREIGHGALAERALRPVLPKKEDFPYTIRLVSEILESNGSSSMATVCAGTLALMDAGVPISAPVSGIAMGLVTDGNEVAVLTDIAGLEDHLGDMDFKVTGTAKGVTALQLDVKNAGLSEAILTQALSQARQARLEILEHMAGVIAQPREDLSMYAPRITQLKINTDRIRDLIGPGGKIIRKIIADTGAAIEVEDDGTVNVASNSGEASAAAIKRIKELTDDVEIGRIYHSKVKRLMNFGAFCEIMPGREGLVHVSELADHYVAKVEDEVKIGDEFDVKVIEIDEQKRINLSRKQAMKPEEKKTEESGTE